MSRLRTSALEARRDMTDLERGSASAIICDSIVHSHEFMACKTIACYLPTDNEVDPTTIIARAWSAGKRVFAPVTDIGGIMFFRQLTPNTEVAYNRFGLLEPVVGPSITANALDVVITPVVAFDEQCFRIGMGGGYFDRCFHFLKRRRKWLRPKLIGVAFDCQKVENFAPNPWDVPLYRVVTESS